jgi:hypothetical protein
MAGIRIQLEARVRRPAAAAVTSKRCPDPQQRVATPGNLQKNV